MITKLTRRPPVPRRSLFKFFCDAPGCVADYTSDTNELAADASTWDSYEVNDTTLYGCCEHHLAAAILNEMGYTQSAKLLMEAARTVTPVPKEAP
jgi:hypothetical protein